MSIIIIVIYFIGIIVFGLIGFVLEEEAQEDVWKAIGSLFAFLSMFWLVLIPISLILIIGDRISKYRKMSNFYKFNGSNNDNKKNV